MSTGRAVDMTPSATGSRASRREDFALEAVPADRQRPGVASLFSVTLAIPSALVFFAVGGALGQAYGTVALLTGVIVASVIIGGAGWMLTSFAARSGLDSDLISIRAGFGMLGSAITSAIYSINFIVLYALETAIIAGAVHTLYPGFPKALLFIAAGLVILALTWYGITSLSRVMTITLPLFVVLVVVAATQVGDAGGHGSFWSYSPPGVSIDPTAWLSVLAALLAFVVNATVAADVGRFLGPKRRRAGAFLLGGVLQVVAFGGATLLGAWFSFRLGGGSEPGAYLVTLLGGWGLACVLLSQARINMINAYSGSLSLSNFGARGLGVRPGRHIWMVALVAISTVLAMVDISAQLVSILTFEAVFVMAWVSTLISYIVVFDLDTPKLTTDEDLEAAPRINVVGVGALAAALAVSTPLAFGAGGELGQALAPLAAMLVAPIGVVALRRWARSGEMAHSLA
jgi:purine-cytosine permease-like protein